MKKTIILLILLLSFLFITSVNASPGRFISGTSCHNSKTEGYHCHSSNTSTYNSYSTYTEVTPKERNLSDQEIFDFVKNGNTCINLKNSEDRIYCYEIQRTGDFYTKEEIINELKKNQSCSTYSSIAYTNKICNEIFKNGVYTTEEIKKETGNCNKLRRLEADYKTCKQERSKKSNIGKVKKTVSKSKNQTSTKLQTKIDKINIKIEAIYLKKPSLIINLQRQIKKIVPKLKKNSDVYILVIAIDNKIQELIDNSNSTKASETKVINSEKNTFNDSFSKAKKYLENDVYNTSELSKNTFYCGCDYSSDKKVDSGSCGFQNNGKYVSRSKKIEWEHIVPAQAFGQSFKEWRDGDTQCIDSKGKSFKGRNCASKVNTEYRYMQADMYNLVPAIGSINALRSNYSYAMIEGEERQFGTCNMEIKNRKAEPKEEIQGDIARVYMYMDSAYPDKGIISNKNKRLFESWDKLDPVSDIECKRYKLIKSIQGNENNILKNKCN